MLEKVTAGQIAFCIPLVSAMQPLVRNQGFQGRFSGQSPVFRRQAGVGI